MNTHDGKSSIQVIDRMMKLIEVLAAHTEPVNLKQLASLTGLHPSSAHRILNVMVEKGLVAKQEPGTYRLGLKLLELGNLVKARLDIRREALPFMQRLHQEINETVNLSLREGDEMVYVERTASGRAMMRVVQIVGARAPLHITAVGKIFLAEAGDEEARAYARRTGLPAYTPHTLTNEKALLEELARVRRRGVAFDDEEAEKGVCCIGAGIRDADGRLVAGLSISAPAERFDRNWAQKVKETAQAISAALGYRQKA
ncbi:MAG: IclR family transcriptional regulator [Burkholderiales bacterium]|nr:IclR family transcriptional regulator [Burkholderiales bacterium]